MRYLRLRTFGRPPVERETTKAKARRQREGFFESFCQGKGLDIGYGGDLITASCRPWDMEHGDAQYLRYLNDSAFDFVYSSHTLEHMVDAGIALGNWWRVLKPGGFLILYIPHRDFYEKKSTLPSRWNPDHKHFFLVDRSEEPDTIGIVPLIENTLSGYELIYVKECSEGRTVADPVVHPDGEYSIELVLKRLVDA
jgi:SAM-dependent methyltransferase